MPPPRTAPTARTRFVGRRKVLSDLLALAARERLVTVVGAGGAGKTRTVLALLESAGTEFDPVHWMELAPISDPARLAPSLCSSLGARPGPGMTAREATVRHLGRTSGTLVLDNCEHLSEAVAELVRDLHERCPELRLIATSREPLGLGGEVLFPMPTMTVPPAGCVDPTQALSSEAVRLFVDRVTALRPDFRLTPDLTPPVVALCRRLEGLPLALELAAARTRVLTLAQIADRLDRVLTVLEGRKRDVPERHRTMTATLEWSHALLEADEQVLFRRLGVFAGAADLDACEAVCGGDPLDDASVLDLLGRLVDRSLVVVEETTGGARYRLLEPVAQFARVRLAGSSDGEAVREAHAHWYVRLAEVRIAALHGPRREPTLRLLETEMADLRRAWNWAMERRAGPELARLARHLFWAWNALGLFQEGRRDCESALERLATEAPGREVLSWAAGALAWTQGDLEEAETRLRESIDRCAADRAASTEEIMGLAWRELAGVLMTRGLMREAEEAFQTALRHLPPGADWDRALALLSLGHVQLELGDDAAAARSTEEGRTRFARTGDGWGRALAELMMGLSAARHGDLETGLRHGRTGLEMQRSHGDLWNEAQTLLLVGEIEWRLGRPRLAVDPLRRAVRNSDRMGDSVSLAHGLDLLARVEATLGDPVRALRLAAAAESVRDRSGAGAYVFALDRDEPRDWVEGLRARLNPAEAARVWAEGYARSGEIVGAGVLVDTGESASPSGGSVVGPPREARLVIRGLGPTEVVAGGRRLKAEDWGYALPRELLFYLLVHGPATKGRIGLDFWPDADAEQLRGRFRTAVHRLRNALGDRDWVRFEAGHYGFRDGAGHWFDVEAFEGAVAQARNTIQGDPDGAASHLEDAVALYRGDFLAGEDPGPWADPVRSRLRRAYVDSLVSLGRIHASQGAMEGAREVLLRATAEEPLEEAPHLELARVLGQTGRVPAALELLKEFEGRLEAELGIGPSRDLRGVRDTLGLGRSPGPGARPDGPGVP